MSAPVVDSKSQAFRPVRSQFSERPRNNVKQKQHEVDLSFESAESGFDALEVKADRSQRVPEVSLQEEEG